ncbi:hypothetical protein M3I54_22145 [Paraburkholderia sp. CNPSo 3274]|uniref:hypothetical protein n=1 Tax=Paraburkholderia sp. CNPSo 3274 TaxID=2940932 RepID=UPI0020B690D8|nr:hypothetical protein [Paraburkholderia sp. CNPSo 3274]MCP3709647.1 hypothetical protein [Paraburkholderia sp. CNPSo 3274]
MRNAHAGTHDFWLMYAVRILVRRREKSSSFVGRALERPFRTGERVPRAARRLLARARKCAISFTLRDMLRNPLRHDLQNVTAATRAVSPLAQVASVWVKAKAKKQPLI